MTRQATGQRANIMEIPGIHLVWKEDPCQHRLSVSEVPVQIHSCNQRLQAVDDGSLHVGCHAHAKVPGKLQSRGHREQVGVLHEGSPVAVEVAVRAQREEVEEVQATLGAGPRQNHTPPPAGIVSLAWTDTRESRLQGTLAARSAPGYMWEGNARQCQEGNISPTFTHTTPLLVVCLLHHSFLDTLRKRHNVSLLWGYAGGDWGQPLKATVGE